MKKEIPKKGYRTLAIIWTLAAASMAVAVIRRMTDLGPLPLLLLVLSTLTAANFWRTYHKTAEDRGIDPFDAPPVFADDPILFDDDPVPFGDDPNQDPEEKDNE